MIDEFHAVYMKIDANAKKQLLKTHHPFICVYKDSVCKKFSNFTSNPFHYLLTTNNSDFNNNLFFKKEYLPNLLKKDSLLILDEQYEISSLIKKTRFYDCTKIKSDIENKLSKIKPKVYLVENFIL